jgi:phospholipase/carboxylesterase
LYGWNIFVLNIYTIDPQGDAQACVIWLHGLGANAADMRHVVEACPPIAAGIRHVFVDAPVRPVTLNNHMRMPAWYDVTGLTLQDREDKPGILQSEQAIHAIITAQITHGIPSQHIYIAGFSQGGAMALFIGLRAQHQLGGIIALSGYLPLQNECIHPNHLTLPIFMAAGIHDQIVVPVWTKLSYDFIKAQGYMDVQWKEYAMEHTICLEEVNDIAQWLQTQIQNVLNKGK